jgi:septum formation protein
MNLIDKVKDLLSPARPEVQEIPPHVILASGSPRRKELLELTGLAFAVEPPDVDESVLPNETPREHVERLAVIKALKVAGAHPDDVTLGCDTVVMVNGGTILGKPKDAADARRMLEKLSGREHSVISGVAALWPVKNIKRVVVIETKVRFKPLEKGEIDWYLATGEPMDKAGAYALQGKGAIFVEGIVGSHTNVVGLPLMETVLLLRSFGVKI